MEIKYKDIPEQEIINLIAWYVKEKGSSIIIHMTDGTDIEISARRKEKDDGVVECPVAAIYCP